MCSENKGADQLRGYREADLRLCFRICKKLVFSRRGSIINQIGKWVKCIISALYKFKFSQKIIRLDCHRYFFYQLDKRNTEFPEQRIDSPAQYSVDTSTQITAEYELAFVKIAWNINHILVC